MLLVAIAIRDMSSLNTFILNPLDAEPTLWAHASVYNAHLMLLLQLLDLPEDWRTSKDIPPL